MLVLFETPAGFAIFKLLDEKKLLQSENLFEDFTTPEGAKKVVKLKMFEKFKDTTDALASAAALIEGKTNFFCTSTHAGPGKTCLGIINLSH